MPRLRSTLHGGLVTGRHVGQNRLKTVSGRSHAWFRKFGAQTILVFESREETQIRPIVQGGKKDFFHQFKMLPVILPSNLTSKTFSWIRCRRKSILLNILAYRHRATEYLSVKQFAKLNGKILGIQWIQQT